MEGHTSMYYDIMTARQQMVAFPLSQVLFQVFLFALGEIFRKLLPSASIMKLLAIVRVSVTQETPTS